VQEIDSYLSFPHFFHNQVFLNLNCFFIAQQTHFLFFFVWGRSIAF